MFKFPNVYTDKSAEAKIKAMHTCHLINNMCATDLNGNPQAYFRLPVVLNKKVLGRQRSKSVELIEHRPTLLLTHNAQ